MNSGALAATLSATLCNMHDTARVLCRSSLQTAEQPPAHVVHAIKPAVEALVAWSNSQTDDAAGSCSTRFALMQSLFCQHYIVGPLWQYHATTFVCV